MTTEINGLAEWFEYGDRGISSNTIVEVMEGHLPGAISGHRWYSSHPLDPSDFYRCYKLLRAVPAYRENLHKMETVSPEWCKLVKHWDELENLLLAELSAGTAPKLFDRMQELIEAAHKEGWPE